VISCQIKRYAILPRRQPFILFWQIRRSFVSGSAYRVVDGTIPAAFKVTESTVTSKGVIIVNYERAGAVQTGSV
jgi:hypothetical protein